MARAYHRAYSLQVSTMLVKLSAKITMMILGYTLIAPDYTSAYYHIILTGMQLRSSKFRTCTRGHDQHSNRPTERSRRYMSGGVSSRTFCERFTDARFSLIIRIICQIKKYPNHNWKCLQLLIHLRITDSHFPPKKIKSHLYLTMGIVTSSIACEATLEASNTGNLFVYNMTWYSTYMS